MEPSLLTCAYPGCSQTFHDKTELQLHVECFHANSNRLQCSVCLKILSSRQNLREHLNIHTGAKPYVCQEPGCGLTFRQGSQLSAHKRIHVAVRKATEQNTIRPLSVSSRQLTQLLKNFPDALEDSSPESEEPGSLEDLKLPPLTYSQSWSTLPRYR